MTKDDKAFFLALSIPVGAGILALFLTFFLIHGCH